jgi:hypothetical protein
LNNFCLVTKLVTFNICFNNNPIADVYTTKHEAKGKVYLRQYSIEVKVSRLIGRNSKVHGGQGDDTGDEEEPEEDAIDETGESVPLFG